MEETKLEGVRPGYRAEITPLGSNKVLKGTVDSVAAGVTNASSTRDDKGMATIDSNLEWVRLSMGQINGSQLQWITEQKSSLLATLDYLEQLRKKEPNTANSVDIMP